MLMEDVLEHPTRVLTARQRRQFFDDGSLVLLGCRVIHGSAANESARMRPLLLNVYSSADSMPYVSNPIPSDYEGRIVRGKPARFSCHDPRGCELPPDWSHGYVGPWAHQAAGRGERAAG